MFVLKFKPLRFSLSARSFLVKWYPELGRFPNDEERADAYFAATDKLMTNKWCLLVCVGGAMCVLAVSLVLAQYRPRFHQHWLICLAGLLILFLSTAWIFRADIRRHLRRQLLYRGIPVCIQCGYDLTGNVTGFCPECGKPFKLTDWCCPPVPLPPSAT